MTWKTISVAGVEEDVVYERAVGIARSMVGKGFVEHVVEIPFISEEGYYLWLNDKKQNFAIVARAHRGTPFVWLDDKEYIGDYADLQALNKEMSKKQSLPQLLQRLYTGRNMGLVV